MLRIVGTLCLAALTLFTCWLLNSIRVTVDAVPGQLATSRDLLLSEVRATRSELSGQLNRTQVAILNMANSQASGLRKDATTVLGDSLSIADRRIGDSLARVDMALGTLAGIRTDLQPTLRASAALVTDAQESLDDVYYDLKASVESATVASTSVAKASQSVEAALPALLADAGKVVQNSDATTAETAKVMANLDAATRPLPRWLRYPLAITGAVAPTVAGAISAAAATGAFR